MSISHATYATQKESVAEDLEFQNGRIIGAELSLQKWEWKADKVISLTKDYWITEEGVVSRFDTIMLLSLQNLQAGFQFGDTLYLVEEGILIFDGRESKRLTQSGQLQIGHVKLLNVLSMHLVATGFLIHASNGVFFVDKTFSYGKKVSQNFSDHIINTRGSGIRFVLFFKNEVWEYYHELKNFKRLHEASDVVRDVALIDEKTVMLFGKQVHISTKMQTAVTYALPALAKEPQRILATNSGLWLIDKNNQVLYLDWETEKWSIASINLLITDQIMGVSENQFHYFSEVGHVALSLDSVMLQPVLVAEKMAPTLYVIFGFCVLVSLGFYKKRKTLLPQLAEFREKLRPAKVFNDLERDYIEEKTKEIKALPAEVPTFEKTIATEKAVIQFIEEQLSTVNVHIIMEHFNLSSRRLYQLLGNRTPGKEIHKMRKEKAKSLKAEGKSLKEIAVATGFSESYLKKVFSKKTKAGS
ncbi:MAG: hypothetical protein LAT76_11360 [Schleiferiaceae bacterium]|nr:hypothetical protein [Schleiferiaceae bacterium]